MQQRTWPYGTRLKAKIEQVHPKQKMVVLVDEKNEGHIIVGGDHKVEPVIGLNAVMEFTKGGPTGGYWRIVEVTP